MAVSYSKESMFGGELWRISPSASLDENLQLVRDFLDAHVHQNWTLSIFNKLTPGPDNTVEIDCLFAEIGNIAEFIIHQEKAYPIEWIGENPLSKSYVIGMPCYRGRLSIPGRYKAEDGRLREVML